jgi:hypothetical protein
LAIWLVAIVGFGFSSPRGSWEVAASYATPPPMSFAVLDSDSDAPAKEYCLSDREDEREGENEDESIGKVPNAVFSLSALECQCYSRFGFPIANCWAMGLGPAARVPFLRC